MTDVAETFITSSSGDTAPPHCKDRQEALPQSAMIRLLGYEADPTQPDRHYEASFSLRSYYARHTSRSLDRNLGGQGGSSVGCYRTIVRFQVRAASRFPSSWYTVPRARRRVGIERCRARPGECP